MNKISDLLTGKLNGKKEIDVSSLKKQKFAVATALQILNYLPIKRKHIDWQKYEHLRGVLLADEVGGGKTFEALSIISHAFLSKNPKNKSTKFRVLIIAAPAIRSNWVWIANNDNQKSSKFKQFIDQTNLSDIKKKKLENLLETAKDGNIITSKKAWKDIYKTRQGVWITSYPAMPSTKKNNNKYFFKVNQHIKFPPDNFFDYIIADEAHIVKSGYAVRDENTSVSFNNSAIRKIDAVLNANPNAKLLLLSATPFQNNIHELIHMISLVEKPNYMNNSVVKIIEEGLLKLQAEIELLKKERNNAKERILDLINSFDNEIGSLIGKENDDFKRPKEISTNKRKNGLDDFIRDIMIRNKKELPEIISNECHLNDAEKLQYLLFRDIITNKDEEERDMVSVKLSQLVSSDSSFRNSLSNQKQIAKYNLIKKLFNNNHLLFENKFNVLLDVIDNQLILTEKKVIVIFCRFIPTIDELEKRLKKKYLIKILHGTNTKVNDRKKILDDLVEFNRNALKPIIFIVSQVGNEGLDFDKFSNTVIHFDGHFNPAVIDQRNGRVYRRDNKKITAKHIYLKETYDEKIKFIELEKRKMKNFFLGDKELNFLFDKILSEDIKNEKLLLDELKKINFDFEPKLEYLTEKYKKLL